MINAVPPCSALMKESRQQNISAGFATNEIDVLAVLSFVYCCKIVLMTHILCYKYVLFLKEVEDSYQYH